MAIELRVPALGESITQATVGELAQEGGRGGQGGRARGRGGEREGDRGAARARCGRAAKILKASGDERHDRRSDRRAGGGAVAATARPTAAPPLSPPFPAAARGRGPARPRPRSVAAPRLRSAGEGVGQRAAARRRRSPVAANGAPRSGGVRAPPSVRRLMAERGLDAAAVSSGPWCAAPTWSARSRRGARQPRAVAPAANVPGARSARARRPHDAAPAHGRRGASSRRSRTPRS